MELATANSDPSDGTPSGGSGPIISLVNGIWVDRRFPLKQSFKQLADHVYKAKSESVDFQKAEIVACEINAWAKKSSKGHIQKLVSSKSLREAVLVLASALYFKGSWAQRFRALDTNHEYFHLLNRKGVRVKFMKKSNTYKFYRSCDGFKQLKMEYKTGQDDKKYAMHIFLPSRYDGLQELIQKFHSELGLFTQNHELQRVKINALWLPKLKYEYGVDDLAKNMKELGLDLPFRVNAELTEIVDSEGNNVYVTKAIHKSYIEVNEVGTVATSVNAFEVRVGAARLPDNLPPPIQFIADHPFLYMIKEEISGTILFVGAALNPLL